MKIAIISGGNVDIPYLQNEVRKESFDYMIAADSGLMAFAQLGVMPDAMLGDYDSVSADVYKSFQAMHIPNYTYPERKDYTDTELALQHAIERIRESGEKGTVILYGASGSRLDHTLANISLLKRGILEDIHMEIRDTNNRIRLVTDCLDVKKNDGWGKYISLLPMSETVEDICLTGFRYPLYHGCMAQGNSLGISNVLEAEEGRIQIGGGYLLVIESRD